MKQNNWNQTNCCYAHAVIDVKVSEMKPDILQCPITWNR